MKMLNLMKKAQTATEYLIILAVVIIIALIVVSVLGGPLAAGGQATTSASESYWKANKPISITQGLMSSTANDKLVLKNNGDRPIRINNISLDDRVIGRGSGAGFTSGQVKQLAPGQSFTYTNKTSWLNVLNSFPSTTCVAGSSWSVSVKVNYTDVKSGGVFQLIEDEQKLEGVCAN
ncbi:MAG: hypothetical protein ACI8Y7_000118 [Candidatus Woesearchaeota archaeon]|jgi:hypothetical protein